MAELTYDWLTRGLIDFEYKKYQLLAYLSEVRRSFSESKLYPDLADLVFHYNNLNSIRKNKKLWYEQFPTSLEGIDLKKLRLEYKAIAEDDELMKEMQEIIEYALPELKGALSEGKEIYEFVENAVEITPVGLSPLYKDEGYLFIHQPPNKKMSVFRYTLRMFENASEKFRGIKTEFLVNQDYLRFRNLENVKLGLIRKYTELPNPATYFITSSNTFPFKETFMPVATRYLVRYISTT